MTEVKKQPSERLAFDEEGFRMSTPNEIAEYKAKRLKADSIADLGSGIGVQALNFAKASGRVVAVENNRRRLEECRRNAETMGITNMEFIEGDATDAAVAEKLGDVEVIHSDPSRMKRGTGWTFDDLSPNPLAISRLYRQENKSFDVPAFMQPSLLPEGWELEYISLQGELKRLSVYTGGLRKFEKSALSLPSGKRVLYNSDIPRKVEQAQRPGKWLYDLDGSILHSGLLPEFLDKNGGLELLYQDRQKTILTGEKFVTDPFIVRSYSVVDSSQSMDGVKKKLIERRASKVVLRYSLDPSRYYEERRNIERGLEGSATVYIFRFKDRYYLADKVETQG